MGRLYQALNQSINEPFGKQGREMVDVRTGNTITRIGLLDKYNLHVFYLDSSSLVSDQYSERRCNCKIGRQINRRNYRNI